MPKKNMYVLVNMEHGPATIPGTRWLYILPGEEPHTYDDMQDAAMEFLYICDEHGHTPESCRLFKLEPVDTPSFMKAVHEAKPEYELWKDEED